MHNLANIDTVLILHTDFFPFPYPALLLEREPSNQQAQSLNQLIEKGVAREGYIGMALMGGAAAVGSILLAGLMRRGRR